MKSLLSVCLLAGSALAASSTLSNSHRTTMPDNTNFFTCTINGKTFTSIAKDSSLTTTFTYADTKHLSPAALFVNAEKKDGNSTSYIYIQPLNDDAPAANLTAHNNLYQDFYITYKAADNTFYNTANAPGNFEINTIDTVHKIITGKLNCILYSNAKKDWLLITDGKFRLKF